MPIQRDDVRGLEFDFLMEDRDGHIALFSTAGHGPVPEAALPVHEDDTMDVESAVIEALPIIGDSLQEGRGAAGCIGWVELAKRGIYVFDWRHRRGPYDRIVAPSHPVASDSLPLT